MVRVEIPLKDWKAALLVAPVDEARVYLNSVALNFPRGEIAATDGRVLFVAPGPVARHPMVLVPRPAVARAVGEAGKDTTLAVHLSDEGWRIGNVAFQPIDAAYPDYAKIVPKSVSGETAQFDPDLLLRAHRALWLQQSGQPRRGRKAKVAYVAHNGPRPAVLTVAGCLAYCVLMPMLAAEPNLAAAGIPAAPEAGG